MLTNTYRTTTNVSKVSSEKDDENKKISSHNIGHKKFMDDLKRARLKLEATHKVHEDNEEFKEIKAELEKLKDEEENDRHRLLRLNFDEKKMDDKLKAKKKEVKQKFDELRQKNEEFLKEQIGTRQKLEDTKLKQVMAFVRKLKEENDMLEDLKLALDNKNKDIEMQKEEKMKKEQEKDYKEKQVQKLVKYEEFLTQVLKISQNFDKDKKDRDNIIQMIDMYKRLISKQVDLQYQAKKMEEEKVAKQNKKNNSETDSKAELMRMNNESKRLSQTIEKLVREKGELNDHIELKTSSNRDVIIINSRIINAVEEMYKKTLTTKKNPNAEENENDPNDPKNLKNKDQPVSILKQLDTIRDKLRELSKNTTKYEQTLKTQKKRQSLNVKMPDWQYFSS